jgi:hypothetical protein
MKQSMAKLNVEHKGKLGVGEIKALTRLKQA